MQRVNPALSLLPPEDSSHSGHGVWLSSAGYRTHFFKNGIRREYDWATCFCITLPSDPWNRTLVFAMDRMGKGYYFEDWTEARIVTYSAYNNIRRIPGPNELD